MLHKTFELLETKIDNDEAGTFTALASVFGNVDKGGDRMIKGAFTKTLEKWRASGKPIPIILSHQWDDLNAWVGKADPRAIFEDERGLVVQGQLDMEDESARKVHKLMKDGLLTGWSFGYSVPNGGQRRKDGANEVTEVELFETGPTLVGMNPEAQLEAVKQDEKAVWSAAFINDLPDSSFLYIEPGGSKDSEGKTTPRSLRHFPVKGPDGTVDMPHLRNALSRIPQSNLPQSVKDRCTAAARRMMGSQSSSSELEEKEAIEAESDGTHEEPSPAKSRPDALRKESRKTALKVLSGGASTKQPDPPSTEPEPPDQDELAALRRESRKAVLRVLSGGQI